MTTLRPGTNPPWVIAHRGASSSHPENTAAAFDEALRQRCDGIELDVQLSADGVPVVYHDRTLARAGGGRKRVSQLGAAALARLDLGGERIRTLSEILERYGRRTRLLIELKARDRDRAEGRHRRLAEAVAAALRRARLERRVMLLSFDPETLQTASRSLSATRAVLNLKAPRRLSDSLRRRLRTLFALSVDVRTVSRPLVRAVHEIGKPVLVFTCNTPGTVNRALDSGADAIMSDRPAWLRGFLERRAVRR